MMVNDIINKLKLLSKSGIIYESVFFRFIDEENIELEIIPTIYEALLNKDINIITDSKQSFSNDSTHEYRNVVERRNFYLEQQGKYLKESGELIKKKFFEDYFKSRCQSTYMPVTMLGLFDKADEYGKLHIDELVSFFKEYYDNRKCRNLIVERADSIFSKTTPSNQEIKKLILFNPLGRSCLVKYIRYNDVSNYLEINENFWNALHISDVIRIKKQSEKIINDYYKKLSLKK